MYRFRLILLILLTVAALPAQEFSEIIEINDYTDGLQETDGGNSICVYHEYVHILWQEMDSTYSSYVTTSADGGTTFGEDVRLDTTHVQIFGSLAVNGSGTIYAAWDDVDFESEIITGVYLSRSTDHGQTFSEPVTVSSSGVFPDVQADGNQVYVSFMNLVTDSTFGFFFARSTDGGLSFEEPYQISSEAVDYIKMDSPATLVLGSDGTLYFAWNDGRRPDDGSDIYLAVSTDGGQSFGENILVNAPTDDEPRLRTAPGIALGDGNVYLVWREEAEENGDGRRILFSKASRADLIFDPAMEMITGGYASPCITANANGDIYLGYPQSNDGLGLFITKSSDQGITWPMTVMVSQTGEFSKDPSITVDADDVVHAVWTVAREENEDDVYYTQGQIVITTLDERLPQPEQYTLLSNYPNPFNPSTTISYELRLPGRVTLMVFDINGKLVRTLQERVQPAGQYSLNWDGSDDSGRPLTSGIYFCRLWALNEQRTTKMILLE